MSMISNYFNTPYKFTSKELDSETGLYYFGARYYSSDISIWLSVDPLSDKRSWLSPYNYCQWNPVRRVDPDGMLCTDYGLLPDGSIGRIGQVNNEPDRLFKLDEKGNIDKSVSPLTIRDKKILPQLEKFTNLSVDDGYRDAEIGWVSKKSEGKLRTATSFNRKDMISAWLFLSNNNSKEWRLDFNKDNSFRLSTLQLSDQAPSDKHLGINSSSVVWMAHGHAGIATDKHSEHSSMANDYYTSSNYSGYHVYFPNSKNLYSLFGINSKNGKALVKGPIKTNGTYNSVNILLK